MKRFSDEVHKIKIVALFQRTMRYYSKEGMVIYEENEYLVIKCHEKFYELDISPIHSLSERKIFHVKPIDDIQLYIKDKRKNTYDMYIANEKELTLNHYNDGTLLVNNCIVVDCEEDMLLMINEKEFVLFEEGEI